MAKISCFNSVRDNDLSWLFLVEQKKLCRIFVKIFCKDPINVQQLLQEEKGYMKVTVNISHAFSSPEACADTNKSFRMFYPPLYTVHQTALRVEREEAACITHSCQRRRNVWMTYVWSYYLMWMPSCSKTCSKEVSYNKRFSVSFFDLCAFTGSTFSCVYEFQGIQVKNYLSNSV